MPVRTVYTFPSYIEANAILPVAAVEALDLSTNVSLRSLEFNFSVYLYTYPLRPSDTEHLAGTFLSRIYSPNLHTLTFCIRFRTWPYAVDTEWMRFPDLRLFDGFADPPVDDGMVAATAERMQQCARNLRRLTLRLTFESSVNSAILSRVEHDVRQQLPKLEERGILHVEGIP